MNIWDWAGQSSPLDGVLNALGRLAAGSDGELAPLPPAPEPELEPPLDDRPRGGLVRFWWPAVWAAPKGYDVERVFVRYGCGVQGRRVSPMRRWFGVDVSRGQRTWAAYLLDRMGAPWWDSDGGRGSASSRGDGQGAPARMPRAWGSPARVDGWGRWARWVLGESRWRR